MMLSAEDEAMTGYALELTRDMVVAIPLMVVLVWLTVDIWRRKDLRHKVLWTLGCWLLWPVMIAYLAARPRSDGGPRRTVGQAGDPRSQLVLTILEHEQGDSDEASFAGKLGDLRRG